MLVLITYDVNTTTKAGEGRLRKVAKVCTKYGQRVQNSVFECNIDWEHRALLIDELKEIIDQKNDSIRIYNLGNKYHSKINHLGKETSYDAEGVLLI